MINKKIGVLLLLMVLFSMGAKAQLTTSVKLNEVLVVNEDNFVDDYGKRIHGLSCLITQQVRWIYEDAS